MKHTDKFFPTPLNQLLAMILKQEARGEIFNISNKNIFRPTSDDVFKTAKFSQPLDSPLGMAAGPHTQLAQNIVASWLVGGRYIELKTVQTLDTIEVSKPCIDMQDEGYNCEWSQELTLQQSFNEYLNAWIIIHILSDKFGFANVGTIFNMSVGYNMEGILNPNVQWFFDKMNNCESELLSKIKEIEKIYPRISQIKIPTQISNNITLSTMHGCPPEEIEKIGMYLINERKLNTLIKLNPTLLGDGLREILKKSGYQTEVPDLAFEHDLKYEQAILLITNLQTAAKKQDVFFGLKLTNTLESINNKNIFGGENTMMYMSGRALHQISVNVARRLQNEFDGLLNLSFSAGADAFNISSLLACGFDTVTVCSDILKPGGYGRMLQYFEEIKKNFSSVSANSIDEFILAKSTSCIKAQSIARLENLNRYADEVLEDSYYQKVGFVEPSIKTDRELSVYDCISAPCISTCPTNQNIPDYMYYTSHSEYEQAFKTIMQNNPFPLSTGMICDHTCQQKCTRINYDNSVLIREIKRFIAEQKRGDNEHFSQVKNVCKVAIIGAGPGGISAAYYLASYGFDVTVYESKQKSGGMLSDAVPTFRLKDAEINKDIERAEKLGVKILYGHKIDASGFENLREEYKYIFIAVGAQLSSKYKIEGIEAAGVIEPLEFLHQARENKITNFGKKIAIIGGGNTAMDSARVAYRLSGEGGVVKIIYRRTIKEMPADLGEIKAVMQEGIEILELTTPEKVILENNKVKGLLCSRMRLGEKDKSGRPKPIKIEGSEYEMEFDTIIPAIGQDLNIDFVDNELLKSDELYFTRINNVFIGGDAMRGAATAIKAIADGRKVAELIVAKENRNFEAVFSSAKKELSTEELKQKRITRKFATKVEELPIDSRKNFNTVTTTLTELEAKEEASRCLQCDMLCNICVTVCPNMANFSYQTEPKKYDIYDVSLEDKDIEVWTTDILRIKQKYQIINIADWCNECGNCNTFCPTNSAPYKVKPKIHLTKSSFDNHVTGFYFKNETSLLYKDGEEITLFKENKAAYYFENKYIQGTIDKTTLEIIDCELLNETEYIRLDILPLFHEIYKLKDVIMSIY